MGHSLELILNTIDDRLLWNVLEVRELGALKIASGSISGRTATFGMI